MLPGEQPGIEAHPNENIESKQADKFPAAAKFCYGIGSFLAKSQLLPKNGMVCMAYEVSIIKTENSSIPLFCHTPVMKEF